MADNFFGLTDVGQVRGNNEDTFIAQPVQQNRYILAAVIDGVGGYEGGEIAAETARVQMTERLDEPAADVLKAMTDAFKSANEHIYTQKTQQKELASMACVATLAVVDVQNNQFYYAHVGDTRLYLLRDHSLVKITKDHSFVGFLEDSGRLTEAAAMSHPKRNEINKALGFDPNSITNDHDYIETGQSPFLPGDTLLLCSDGLTDMVDKNEMTQILTGGTSLEQKAHQLIGAANKNGGRDNITVVLVQNNKTPSRPAATMPVTVATKPAEPTQPVVAAPAHVASNPPAEPVHPQKSNSGLVALLSVFCLVFLGAAGWFYWQSTHQQPVLAVAQPVQQPAPKAENALEKRLQDTLSNFKGDTLLLSDAVFTQPVMVNDTLNITKDTLYIKTNGKIQLTKDSTYTGPAIALAANCKHIVIDGLSLQGFDTGIITPGNALQLKNVQFANCRYPVQVAYTFLTDKPVTAKVPAMSLNTDTSKSTTTNQPAHGRK